MAEFLEAYRKTALFEGGFANVKGDAGGPTYAGIARNFWPNWEGWRIVDRYMSLKAGAKIHDPELEGMVKAFYKREFWDRVKGDYITDQEAANQIYDFAVNAGVSAAIKASQRTLGIPETGRMDSATLNKINNV